MDQKVQKLAERAAGNAKRSESRDKVLHGPEPIEVDGATVGTVAIVERSRKRGEPAILVVERDANGATVPVSLLGVIAATSAFGLAPAPSKS